MVEKQRELARRSQQAMRRRTALHRHGRKEPVRVANADPAFGLVPWIAFFVMSPPIAARAATRRPAPTRCLRLSASGPSSCPQANGYGLYGAESSGRPHRQYRQHPFRDDENQDAAELQRADHDVLRRLSLKDSFKKYRGSFVSRRRLYRGSFGRRLPQLDLRPIRIEDRGELAGSVRFALQDRAERRRHRDHRRRS